MSVKFRFGRLRPSSFRSIVILLIAWPCCLYLILAYIIPRSPTLVPVSLLAAKRPLLVTAHPDDESLFFGPTLLGITKVGNAKELRILVLSSGNNYGLGGTRKAELKEACRRIGAKECLVLDRKDIQDNPKEWWDQELIVKIVQRQVTEWQIDSVLTFDSGGVSGHINHRAVSAAVVKYKQDNANFPPTFILRTVSTFFPPRKYTGIFDLPLTTLRFTFRIFMAFFYRSNAGPWTVDDVKAWKGYDSKGLFVSSAAIWRQNVAAFWAHTSQRSWDRWLYMIVSRYMWFNDIIKVESRHE